MNQYLIFVITAILIFIYIIYKPTKSKDSYIDNSYNGIAELNKYIQMYNSLLTRFDITATRVNRTCYKNKDTKSLKRLESLANEFMNTYPKCANLIDEIKELEKYDNRYERLIFDIKKIIADMEIILEKIEGLEYNSTDYSSNDNTNNYFELNDTYSSIYFSGCNTLDSLNKRYHILAKAYHPDNNFGDQKTFQKMKNEYEELKKFF